MRYFTVPKDHANLIGANTSNVPFHAVDNVYLFNSYDLIKVLKHDCELCVSCSRPYSESEAREIAQSFPPPV